jgi:hypothetical protein
VTPVSFGVHFEPPMLEIFNEREKEKTTTTNNTMEQNVGTQDHYFIYYIIYIYS